MQLPFPPFSQPLPRILETLSQELGCIKFAGPHAPLMTPPFSRDNPSSFADYVNSVHAALLRVGNRNVALPQGITAHSSNQMLDAKYTLAEGTPYISKEITAGFAGDWPVYIARAVYTGPEFSVSGDTDWHFDAPDHQTNPFTRIRFTLSNPLLANFLSTLAAADTADFAALFAVISAQLLSGDARPSDALALAAFLKHESPLTNLFFVDRTPRAQAIKGKSRRPKPVPITESTLELIANDSLRRFDNAHQYPFSLCLGDEADIDRLMNFGGVATPLVAVDFLETHTETDTQRTLGFTVNFTGRIATGETSPFFASLYTFLRKHLIGQGEDGRLAANHLFAAL